jgi:reverse gyrase
VRRRVFKEVLLMTLARASSSDSNVSAVEVQTVQRIIQRVIGEEVSQEAAEEQ